MAASKHNIVKINNFETIQSNINHIEQINNLINRMEPDKYTEIEAINKTINIKFNTITMDNYISKGSFGSVWKVTDKEKDKEYALKAIERTQIIMMAKEIASQMAALDQEPNIIQLKEFMFGQESSKAYIIMELCMGDLKSL